MAMIAFSVDYAVFRSESVDFQVPWKLVFESEAIKEQQVVKKPVSKARGSEAPGTYSST